ncbi:aly/REF export factor 2-like [Teleopsis dalmanni]|uniref:aly/REF export factor 2-like n=1 Tax=Teleopsis dalmanni TaxID=139649 RepID=UPI0018CD04C7|nr:aly/REF export factor 2-like [Teleopsis dalmanni]
MDLMDVDKTLDELIAERKVRRKRKFVAMDKIDYSYDKSLDDIIADKKKCEQRPRRERRRYVKYKNQHSRRWVRKNRVKPTTMSKKHNYTLIMVYNLDKYVTNDDLMVLFEDFGTVMNLCIHYNVDSESLGIAHVMYKYREDALTAITVCNGVKLDGKEMLIELSNIWNIRIPYLDDNSQVNPYNEKGFNRSGPFRRR